VLTQESLRSRVPSGTSVLVLDSEPVAGGGDAADAAASAGAAAAEAVATVDADLDGETPAEALAYVIYTSGSTGEPKGVGVPHRGVSRLVLGANYVSLGPGEIVAQASSSSFDATTFEVWGPLLNGALVAGMNREVTLSPPAFAEELRTRAVTVLFLTTALFNHLVREAPDAVSGRTVLFGGEAVDPQWVRKSLEVAPARRLLHVYGPTETTTFATFHPVTHVDPAASTVPIGRPISNTTSYVLDPNLEPVPAGLTGELYLGGDGVARGYLERPALTAERFVPDPFGSDPGGRLYRTGDLVRALPDGSLEFLGRVDHQVKLRGFRIELGEIEALLVRHPAVRDAVVLVREDEPGDRRLVAYLVWREGAGVAAAELRAHLGAGLPDYMIPAAFVALEALPLNRNGKVDRAALPAPEGRRLELAEEHVAPRSPVEEILAGIYAEVLGLESVSAGDSFFELGGHSLRATQVISRVREALQVELPLRALFESPSVAGLALRVEEERRRGQDEVAPSKLGRRAESGPAPLSFAQQRLWFLDRLEPGSPVYNLPLVLRLSGPLDERALGQAFLEIQRRHEVLRTSFVSEAGVPVQRIAAAAGTALERTDLGDLAPALRDAEWRRIVADEGARPFDLARGPLLRGHVLRLAESEHVLVVVMHHAVSDGWSLGVLTRELEVLYAAFRERRPSPLPELEVQYADFAVWQRDSLRGETLESQAAYWRRTLASCADGATFPSDRSRPARQSFRGGRESSQISRKLSDDLRALSRRQGVTLFMTLLSALDVLLYRHTGQSDVVVGTPIAGRTRAEVEDLVGFFVNTLVLRADLSGRPTFRALLERVRETSLGAYAHQDLPFERLVEDLQPQRDLGRTPFFQVMFNLVNLESRAPKLDGLEVETLPNPEPESKFDLTLYALDGPAEIRFVAVYNADLYEAARIAEILAQLEQVLAQAVASPELPIDRLSLVTPSARRHLPEASQPLARAAHQPVTARLAAQASRVPDRPAVVDRRHVWSYAELHAASSRLAGHLRALGVGRGDVVAIHGPRSAGIVGAMLGVMKAGGAFLILDPAYPAVRNVECLRQARPKALLQIEGAPLPAALEAFAGELPSRVRLPEDPRAGGPWVEGAPDADVEPGDDDVAYVAFTSGTTGVPKGIVGTHAPVAHFLDWHTRHFGLEERDRFSLLSGLSHDPFLRDVLTPLWLGATLLVPDPEVITGGRLGEWMAREAVTVSHLTPAMARLLTEERRPLPSLRFAFFGGDVLTAGDVSRLRALGPGTACVSYYGATETPQGMGVFVVPESDAGEVDDRRPLPLGKGIADVRLLVLGPGGGLAGVGELGEVHVQTPYLSAGYLGDEALTRERFVPDPFAATARGRLYRTGDLGRYGLDGEVRPAGRADEQVKLRGFRIEPAEIEATLRRHPSVSEAAVVVAEDRRHERRLVAHVVGSNGHVPTPEELRAFLGDHLPDAMVPAVYRTASSLPLTPNGKVDRRALAQAGGDVPTEARSFVAPRTPVEEQLCTIWAGLLGVERVSIHDDFFGLGGHSLLATQAVSRLRDALGVDLPLRRLFETPRVSDLAPVVTQALVDAADPDTIEDILDEVTQPTAEPSAGGSISSLLETAEGE
jgi:amino acid adenylation domain-containing protein